MAISQRMFHRRSLLGEILQPMYSKDSSGILWSWGSCVWCSYIPLEKARPASLSTKNGLNLFNKPWGTLMVLRLPRSPSTSTGSQIQQWIYQHKWKRFSWAQRSERMNNNKGRVKNGKTMLMEEPWLVKDSLFSAHPCPLFSFPVSISKKSAPTCLQCDSRLMVWEVEGVCSKKLDPSSLLAIWAPTQPSSAELTCDANLRKIK